MSRIVGLTAAACVAVGLLAAPAAAETVAQYQIIDLGLGDNSTAVAINQFGHVIGEIGMRPYLWRHGKVTFLDENGPMGGPIGFNNRDHVISLLAEGDGRDHALLWRNGVITDLGFLPGGNTLFPNAINDRDEVVGWGNTGLNNFPHAFRWRDGVLTDLGAPAGFSTFAHDVNDAGTVVGENSSVNQASAVAWRRDGTVHPLTAVARTVAIAINDFGSVAGTVVTGDENHSFVLRSGQFTEIAPPAGFTGFQATDINNRNQVVGNALPIVHGVVWQDGQFATLPTQGGGTNAAGINDRGEIAGSANVGIFPHAVIWTRLTN